MRGHIGDLGYMGEHRGSHANRSADERAKSVHRVNRRLAPMAPLGALSQTWVSVEASLPLGWQISGLWRFDDLWVSLAEIANAAVPMASDRASAITGATANLTAGEIADV